ncbi:hypothetical protein L0Y65_06375 [Candidatus Micrarchaeota archaeon]|nr:hypothetical protein [Candidatus Micrarchaeota archaeon]
MASNDRSSGRNAGRRFGAGNSGIRGAYAGSAGRGPGPVAGACVPDQSGAQKKWAEQIVKCVAANGGLTRADFLRLAGVAATGVAAAGAGLGGTVHAQVPPGGTYWYPVGRGDMNPDSNNIIQTSYGYDVYPVGDPTILALPNKVGLGSAMTADSRNIQWAVDNVNSVETVLLKSVSKGGVPTAFAFPKEGEGYFNYNVFHIRVGYGFDNANPTVDKAAYSRGCRIIGETNPSDKGGFMPDGTYQFPNGKPITQINDGFFLFSLTSQNSGQTIELRNILFDKPVSHAAGCQLPSRGNTIIDNCIVNNMQHSSVYNFRWTQAFWSFQPSGSFTVTNCLIDIPNDAPPYTYDPPSNPFTTYSSVGGITLPGSAAKNAVLTLSHNTININSTNYKYARMPTGGSDIKIGIGAAQNTGTTNITWNVLNCRPVGLMTTHLRNANISNNFISLPSAVSAPFYPLPAGVSPDYTVNYAFVPRGNSASNTFSGNDTSGFHSDDPRIRVMAQVMMVKLANLAPSSNTFSGNIFGPTDAYSVVCLGNANNFLQNSFGQSFDDTVPCMWVTGSGNTFTGNDFTQTGLKGFLYQVSANDWIRAGDILFDKGTAGNSATVYSGNFSPGDRCSQVADLTFTSANGGSNLVSFADGTYCTPEKQEHLAFMLSQSLRYLENKERIAAMHAELQSDGLFFGLDYE